MRNIYEIKYIAKSEETQAIHSKLTIESYDNLINEWSKLDTNEQNIAMFAVAISSSNIVGDCKSIMSLNLDNLTDEVLSLLAVNCAKYSSVKEGLQFVKQLSSAMKHDYMQPNIEQAFGILKDRSNKC